MMGFSDSPWLYVGFHLHVIFAIITILGISLFFMWAIRLKTDELKSLVIWLLVVGIAGVLISSPFMGGAMGMMGMMERGGRGGKNMMDIDQGMMKDGKMVPGRMMENGEQKADATAK